MFTLQKNSLNIKYKDLAHWLAVCGYMPPQTEGDMARFDKLYSDYEPKYSISDLDFESIWRDEDQFEEEYSGKVIIHDFTQLKMAARGLKTLSHEIRSKVLNNQKLYGQQEKK